MFLRNRLIPGLVVLVLLIGGVLYYTSQKKQPEQSETTKVKIAYLAKSVQALPLYIAIEKKYFKEAGLEIKPVGFDAPNQIIDALISGKADFAAPSTGTGITAISQAKNPNTLKIFALNGGKGPNNIDNVFLIKKDSTISGIQQLRGKKLGILPGIQFRTIARYILDKEGMTVDKDVIIIELALTLQLQALLTGQIDAVLTLEPIKTIGESKNAVKDLVAMPLNKYIADPWYGGGGVVSTKFMQNNPITTKKVLAAFDKSIKDIKLNPNASRKYLKNYTPLNDAQIKEVPLDDWKMYMDFQKSDIDALQKFFDIFTRFKVIDNKVDAAKLIIHIK